MKLSEIRSVLNHKISVEDTSIHTTLDEINKNCKLYLNEVKKINPYWPTSWLYRGIIGGPPARFISHTRTSRLTRDSSHAAQIEFDKLLDANGCLALRRNSIFCTSDRNWAGVFGNLFIIFPIDGQSNYTFTNKSDLTLHTVWSIDSIDFVKHRPYLKTLYLRVENVEYGLMMKNNARKLLSYDSGVIIQALTYYYETKTRHPNLDFELPDISYWFDPEIFKNNYSLQHDTNLSLALDRSFEVYVSGKYYALSYYEHYELVNQRFKL